MPCLMHKLYTDSTSKDSFVVTVVTVNKSIKNVHMYLQIHDAKFVKCDTINNCHKLTNNVTTFYMYIATYNACIL